MNERGSSISRRHFLIGSVLLGGMAGCTRVPQPSASPARTSASPQQTPSGALSATPAPGTSAFSRVSVAVVGAGGQGTLLASRFARDEHVRIVTVCDPDSARARKLAGEVDDLTDRRPATVADLRRVLDDPHVDAVVLATPHHWHVLGAIWALQSGKHVYLEKPATHSLLEGPALLAAWRSSGLVVEIGTQRRSHPGIQEAITAVHDGDIGRVSLARCYSWKLRPPIGDKVNGNWPSTLNPDLWFGPRPIRKPTRANFHYDWHWFYDYGNGGLGNNGVHRLDVARWGMDLDGIGTQVLSLAGRLGPADSGQTPNTSLTVVDFGDRAVAHDLRGLPSRPMAGMEPTDEVAFIGQSGSIIVSRTGGRLVDRDGQTRRSYGTDAANVDPIRRHIKGFVKAVMDGDPQAVAVGPVEGVAAAAMCHSAMVSHRSAMADRGKFGAEQVSAEQVSRDIERLCGPAMAANTEAFLAHATETGDSSQMVYSGIRKITGEKVAGATSVESYRKGYRFPEPQLS